MTCIMLDVDGVLVTGRPEDGRFWADDLERDLGININTLNRHFFAPSWVDVVEGRRDLLAVLNECLPRVAPHVEADVLMSYWFAKDARIDDAVLSDVERLRADGMTVYLATNQEHHRARYLMSELGLGQHVDGMIHSASLGVRKPHAAFFDAAANLTRLPPAQIVLVDDTAENVAGARAAGWRAERWIGMQSLGDLVAVK